MHIKDYPPFFESLHRPYHQSLKTARWACEFIDSRKKKVKSSTLNLEFYIYLVNKLYASYSKTEIADYQGVISKYAVDSVHDYLRNFKGDDKYERILEILRKERFEDVEKQIYSTYKAASYYMNLSKDKLKLINADNELSYYGSQLLRIKSNNHLSNLTAKEGDFYFYRLVENDFLLLITLCFFKRLEFKYKFTDTDNRYFDFVNKMYNVRHFLYNSQSLPNYNKVRGFWINTIKILDKRNRIKKRYLQIILDNSKLKSWFEEISLNFEKYENENFKSIRKYNMLKSQFTNNYIECIIQKKDVLGFVNLYDVKENMKISHKNFEIFLNTFYELEKAKSHIFFSNIVSSIDRRKRFLVRGVSVLKIKYKN